MADPDDDEITRTDAGRDGAASDDDGKFEPGSTFAGYRIEQLVGEGGMGCVYEATKVASGRRVALKVLLEEIAQDERQRTRFKREARAAAVLDHPHVIPIYDADEHEGRLYIAMQFVEGGDVKELVKADGPLDPKTAVGILRDVCDALDFAHENGLVHRDIKPANVMLGGKADALHAYLTDFSLVRMDGGEETVTKAGSVVGTLDYMAPEQIQGMRADKLSDIYALGCVLAFMLTGQAPFPRDSEPAIMWGHLGEPPPVPSEIVPGLPPLLDQVVAKAMAKQPADRFPSAGYLADAAKLALGV